MSETNISKLSLSEQLNISLKYKNANGIEANYFNHNLELPNANKSFDINNILAKHNKTINTDHYVNVASPIYKNLVNFASNCSKILVIDSDICADVALMTQSNPNLEIICIVNENNELSKEIHTNLQEIYPENIKNFFVNPNELTFALKQEYYNSFDGVYITGSTESHIYVNYTLSVLKYLKNECLFILNNTHNVAVFSWANILKNTWIFHTPRINFQQCDNHLILEFKRPKYAICTVARGDAYKKKVANCTKSKYIYARHYNYKLITEENFDLGTMSYGWTKVPQIVKYLPDYDYIFWIDGDAMITNINVCLDTFFLFLPKPFLNLVARDHNEINTGVMLLKNCEETRMMMGNLRTMRSDLLTTYAYEERPMIEILRLNIFPFLFREIIHGKEQIWNSYPQHLFNDTNAYQENDFIVHFVSVNLVNSKEFNLYDLDKQFGQLIGYKPLPYHRMLKIFM